MAQSVYADRLTLGLCAVKMMVALCGKRSELVEIWLILLQMLMSVKRRMDRVLITAPTRPVAFTASATMDIILTTTIKLVMVSSRLYTDYCSQYVERSFERT